MYFCTLFSYFFKCLDFLIFFISSTLDTPCAGFFFSFPPLGPPKISRFFFPLPPDHFRSFSLSGGLLVEFWSCLWGRRGFTRQPENSKRAHLRVPALQKHHQISTRRPPEREKKSENGAGEGKKSAKFWAPRLRAPTLRAPTLRCPTLRAPTLRTPTLGALTFSRSGPHPSGPPTLRAPFLRAPPFGPPSLRAEALRASTFSGFGPLRSSFLSCCSFVFFCVFLIVSISCFF